MVGSPAVECDLIMHQHPSVSKIVLTKNFFKNKCISWTSATRCIRRRRHIRWVRMWFFIHHRHARSVHERAGGHRRPAGPHRRHVRVQYCRDSRHDRASDSHIDCRTDTSVRRRLYYQFMWSFPESQILRNLVRVDFCAACVNCVTFPLWLRQHSLVPVTPGKSIEYTPMTNGRYLNKPTFVGCADGRESRPTLCNCSLAVIRCSWHTFDINPSRWLSFTIHLLPNWIVD